jgi:quercetin dioxygenase-like cupin family protein
MRRLTTTFLATLTVVLLMASFTMAQTHVMQNLASTTWGPAPPMLPPGAQIAVLSGNPMQATPYTIRLKFPANYVIPAHSHPGDENVAVVSGQLFMGMGTRVDKASAQGLGIGGYALMPANVNHFAYTIGETTILLYGMGPVEFKYVNRADDPRTTSILPAVPIAVAALGTPQRMKVR